MSPAQFFKLRSGFASVLAAVSAGNLFADIEWRGTISRNGAPTFALTDTAIGESKWVPMGGAFQTFQVASYDEQRQLLVLTKGGARTELTLASAHVAAQTRPANDELKNLSGIALAEALSKRGDADLREQLAQLRAAQISREELARRLADAERLAQNSPSGATRRTSQAAGKQSAPTPESARDDLRNEAQRSDEEIAKLTAQIEKTAAERRGAVTGAASP